MERIGQWLAGEPWYTSDPRELEARVEAVVERVDGLQHRVDQLEREEESRGHERQ
jgi:hypothetical protein